MPAQQLLPTGIVTLLFTDIEGSTRLLQQLGNDYAGVLAESRRLLRAAFKQWNGHEVDTQGDAFFVAFASATDAMHAATSAQRAFFTHKWPSDIKVRVRIGLHTGEPQPGEEGYIGLDVHKAARIMSSGHGGQILLSPATFAAIVDTLPPGINLQDLGEYHLKDIEGTTRLFQLTIEGLPTDFPPLKTPTTHQPRHDLPTPPTPLIGREQELITLHTLLQSNDLRLLTLTGTAGVGKTRLALQAAIELAGQFPGDIFFVDLAQVSDVESFIPTLAQVLAIREEAGQSLLTRLKERLHEQRTLLLLDNVEQIIAVSPILANILATCPDLKLLVTSRIMLHIQAEQIFDVSPLSIPDPRHLPALTTLQTYPAIALFVQRARAVQPDFQLTHSNAPVVAKICARLDGLPLAIELAAARCRHFSPQTLLARLEQGLGVLNPRTHDLPARQQTLHAAIAWSYELLTPEEQQVFRQLSVFINGATLEALEQICASSLPVQENILERLEALVDKSLLRQAEQAQGETRFWLLQTLREFSLERLKQTGELATTRTAHAEYYLAWTTKVAPFLTGALQAEWLERMEQEYENLRTALEWLLECAKGEEALQLCVSLYPFWEIRGYLREGATLLERSLELSADLKTPLRGEALYLAGFLALIQDEPIRAEAFLHESQLLFRQSGAKANMANILRLQGALHSMRNNYKLANRLLTEAMTLYTETGNSSRAARAREDLAQIAIAQGDYKRARSLLEENLAYYRASGERYPLAYPLFHLAFMLFLSAGDCEQAQSLAEESLTLFKQLQNSRLIAHILCLQAQLLLVEEDLPTADALLKESLSIFKDLEDRYGTATVLIASARLSTMQADYDSANTLYQECLTLLKTMEAKDLLPGCLEGWAEVMLARADPRRAAQLWGKAANIRADLVAPIPPIYRYSYEQALGKARTLLGPTTFRAAWLEGKTVTL